MPRGRQKTLRELGEIPEWLTPGQAAELLQVHPQTVRVWIKQGRIPSQTFGASSRIPRDELFAKRPRSTPKPHASRPVPTASIDEAAPAEGEVVTISNAEAAQILGVSRATIERWVRGGRFTMVAIGANKGKRRIVHDQRFDLFAAERSLR
ncbi:MAG: helix-turn-helix domain-containing protein [Actinomycetota bacterium]|nr:helix-turn-helix domain-containing protein [Actinomycetota bacterium]